MVFISITFAARKIASAFEHPAIGRSQPHEIDFVFFDLAGKRAAGEVRETFFPPRDGSLDFPIKTIWNFQRYCFHRNTTGITADLSLSTGFDLARGMSGSFRTAPQRYDLSNYVKTNPDALDPSSLQQQLIVLQA
jgi:hypothetical protein